MDHIDKISTAETAFSKGDREALQKNLGLMEASVLSKLLEQTDHILANADRSQKPLSQEAKGLLKEAVQDGLLAVKEQEQIDSYNHTKQNWIEKMEGTLGFKLTPDMLPQVFKEDPKVGSTSLSIKQGDHSTCKEVTEQDRLITLTKYRIETALFLKHETDLTTKPSEQQFDTYLRLKFPQVFSQPDDKFNNPNYLGWNKQIIEQVWNENTLPDNFIPAPSAELSDLELNGAYIDAKTVWIHKMEEVLGAKLLPEMIPDLFKDEVSLVNYVWSEVAKTKAYLTSPLVVHMDDIAANMKSLLNDLRAHRTTPTHIVQWGRDVEVPAKDMSIYQMDQPKYIDWNVYINNLVNRGALVAHPTGEVRDNETIVWYRQQSHEFQKVFHDNNRVSSDRIPAHLTEEFDVDFPGKYNRYVLDGREYFNLQSGHVPEELHKLKSEGKNPYGVDPKELFEAYRAVYAFVRDFKASQNEKSIFFRKPSVGEVERKVFGMLDFESSRLLRVNCKGSDSFTQRTINFVYEGELFSKGSQRVKDFE